MGNVDVLLSLEEFPLAPEYHHTEARFANPITYILKIEKEVIQCGICRISPSISKAHKRVVTSSFNCC